MKRGSYTVFHNHCLWLRMCMQLGWSEGFQVQIIFSKKATTRTKTAFLVSLFLICNEASCLSTKLKFLLEPSFMSIWRWGFCFQWLKFLKIYFAHIKAAGDNHECKCSSENGWTTYSIPATPNAVRTPHPIEVSQYESHKYIR